MTIEEDKPPMLGSGAEPSKIAHFYFCLKKLGKRAGEHITNQDGGDRVLATRRELVDSATQTIVADAFYYGKPRLDLSGEELTQGFNFFADVDMQQTSDVLFLRQGCPCAEDGCERAGIYRMFM